MKTVHNLNQIIFFFVMMLILFFGALSTRAQTPVKINKDGQYEAATTKTDSSSGKFFKMGDGAIKPIYVSRAGKYYIIIESKKGKLYRKYLKL